MNLWLTSRWRALLALVCVAAALAGAQQKPEAAAAPAAPVATVVQPVANMHSQPSADSDVVSQAIFGNNVVLLEEQSGWARVRTADDYTGWMNSAALWRGGKAYASGEAATVRSLFAHLYREKSVTSHAPLLTVPFESRLEIAARPEEPGGRWYEVRLPDGKRGYVQAGDINTQVQPLSIAESLELARKFLGLPYTWGGTSSYGYDCSGFTQMLLRQRGTIMPRDADVQAAWSGFAAVQKGELQPGDLLFFGASAQKITHTGMYVGGGMFIHATTHDRPMVQISNLDDPYWTGLLVAMRRLKP